MTALWDPSKPRTGTPPEPTELTQMWEALQEAYQGNLVADPTFLCWPDGDAAMTTGHWQKTGAGSAVARCGAGLGDTTDYFKHAVKLTAGGGADARFLQTILPAATFPTKLRGIPFSVCAAVKSSAASSSRVFLNDGNTTVKTWTINSVEKAVHTGGGAWEILRCPHTLHASSTTKLEIGVEAAAGTALYVGFIVCVIGPIPPAAFLPARERVAQAVIGVAGTLSTGASQGLASGVPLGPFVILATTLSRVGTSGALVVDVNKNAANSAYTTKPTIANGASDNLGAPAEPDGTYANRCFGRSDKLLIDIDTANGADLAAVVHALVWDRPLRSFLGPTDVN